MFVWVWNFHCDLCVLIPYSTWWTILWRFYRPMASILQVQCGTGKSYSDCKIFPRFLFIILLRGALCQGSVTATCRKRKNAYIQCTSMKWAIFYHSSRGFRMSCPLRSRPMAISVGPAHGPVPTRTAQRIAFSPSPLSPDPSAQPTWSVCQCQCLSLWLSPLSAPCTCSKFDHCLLPWLLSFSPFSFFHPRDKYLLRFHFKVAPY